MKVFQAHSDGQVLVPDEPVDLGVGAKYEVTLRPVKGEEIEEKAIQSLREFLLSIAGTAEGDYPSDLARNHDHYLHGRPKR
jgi:hypothetical protein